MKYIINRWKVIAFVLMVLFVIVGWTYVYSYESFRTSFEISNELEGNLFPSAILSTATTDAHLIVPADSNYLGDSKSAIAVRVKSKRSNSKVRITVEETPYFDRSVSEFILKEPGTEYLIYPDIIWDYEALKANNQATPISLAIRVELDEEDLGQKLKTLSMRSVNESMLGYIDSNMNFHDTGDFFAAYVNEDHPMIDEILREALDTRIINRFWGYQGGREENVDKQVYALWNVLQKINFKYSSISSTSLSSNLVYAQRVRTLDDALKSSQINCVDGTVLFASLLRAINIDPILVRTPGHMFVGYYTDSTHTKKKFLEVTMIGDVNLDEYFPDEKLGSTVAGKSQNEASLLTFQKSKEYATRKYEENKEGIHSGKVNYMFLEISKDIRSKIQPIGK